MKQSLISKVMSEMGRRGGKIGGRKGGRSRMASLTPEQRKQLARKAAQARWAKASKENPEPPSKANLEVPATVLPKPETLSPKTPSTSVLDAPQMQPEAPPIHTVLETTTVPPPTPAPQADMPEPLLAAPPVLQPKLAEPPIPPSPMSTPSLSANLVAARANAGKHYEGFDWTADPLGANLSSVESEAADADVVTLRNELGHSIGDLVSQLEAGNQPQAAELIRETLAQIAPYLAPAQADKKPALTGKLRETAFLLDEVRLTLADESGIGIRSAHRALKIWK